MNNDLGGYISKLVLNNGTIVPLNKDDIVVFVGPNNSGKSQSLRDIYTGCHSSENKGVVVSDIELKTSTDGLEDFIAKVAIKNKTNNLFYYRGEYVGGGYNDKTRFGSYTKVFISFLQTEDRLSYCKPQSNIDKGDNVVHPIQLLVEDNGYCNKISSLFNKAFQQKLYCYPRGKNISLRIGHISETVSSGNRIDIANSVLEDIGNLPHIENQGDGMRSFASILLSLGIDYKRIHLFDEPESFLHQAQARIMGRMIGEELKNNQQAFISTHSTDFIKGLLEKAETRVKVIRITRDGNTNHFHILDNHHIEEICNDEMLKHTNILEGLFSNRVVVCEGDVDCLLYSSIEEYLMNKQGHYSESFYLFTGGKSSYRKTLYALQGLNICYKAILDLDAINDLNLIKGIYETCGGDWDNDLSNEYNTLINWINANGRSLLSKEEARQVFDNAISKCNNDLLSPNDIKNIKSSFKNSAIWERVKREGRKAIDDNSVLKAFDNILSTLRKSSIFLLPVGEIESFIPGISGHSHGWLQKVLNTYPSFDDSNYDEIKRFVLLYI